MIQLGNLSYRLIPPYNDKGVSSLMFYTPQKNMPCSCLQDSALLHCFPFPYGQAKNRQTIPHHGTKPGGCPSTTTGKQRVLRKNTDETRYRATATTWVRQPHTGTDRSELNLPVDIDRQKEGVKTQFSKIWTYNLAFEHPKRLKKGPYHYSIQSLIRPFFKCYKYDL